jgi:hypothetical protein
LVLGIFKVLNCLVVDSFSHEVCIILDDCIFWWNFVCFILLACTPSVYDQPLGMALFLLGSTSCGSLCCINLFFLFLRCLGGVLFPGLGTFVWCTPFILLCWILSYLWILGNIFISDICLLLPCINLLIRGNLLNQDWNSLVILPILDGHLYVLFLDAVS